ncbi:MAG: hypothetical protein HC831_08020, partial [Chloroflexia bacterium]|nr:hypothetical protein [Chloroflexia bacterium]
PLSTSLVTHSKFQFSDFGLSNIKSQNQIVFNTKTDFMILESIFSSKDSREFYSSRDIDIDLFNDLVIKKEKESRLKNLFKDIVLRIAEESHCESKKVAAIAVKNGRIIATGINGSISGLTNCDEYWKRPMKKNV